MYNTTLTELAMLLPLPQLLYLPLYSTLTQYAVVIVTTRRKALFGATVELPENAPA
jgi:hypothetical protein